MVKQRKLNRKVQSKSHAGTSVRDRLRKKSALRQPEKTICLAMIVKNESNIIVRLLDSLLGVLNFICITDTGSSDNTVELIEEWGIKNGVTTTVCHTDWQNFKYNRTNCIQNAQKVYPQSDYILLSDADFIWKCNYKGVFDKHLLFEDYYEVAQGNGSMMYNNIRMLKTSIEWEYHLRTHEYITSKNRKLNLSKGFIKTLLIDDREDGGCKDDKFERDLFLLGEDLNDSEVDEYDKTRAKFYYARTLTDLKRYEEAIEMYRERLKDEGYIQEKYYSHFQIGYCYEQLGWRYRKLIEIMKKDEELSEERLAPQEKSEKELYEMYLKDDKWTMGGLMIESDMMFEKADKEYWGAYKRRPTRAEAILSLCRLHRILFHSQRSYELTKIGTQIPRTTDTLFVTDSCYDWEWDVEIMLTACYVGKVKESRAACSRLISREGEIPEWVINNAKQNSKFFI